MKKRDMDELKRRLEMLMDREGIKPWNLSVDEFTEEIVDIVFCRYRKKATA